MSTSTLVHEIAALSPERRELLALLLHEAGLSAAQLPILAQERQDGTFPLSYAQQRLWFLNQLEPDSAFYNTSLALRLRGPLQVEALRRALNEIVCRHAVLRASFPAVDGEPVQVIASALKLALPLTALEQLPEERREAELRRLALVEVERPFDLAHGPLLRAGLLRVGADDHLLVLSIHHIICDGWSRGVVLAELAALYEAYLAGQPSPLPALPIQYADYAVWQRQWLSGAVLEQQLEYWTRQLAELPWLKLPGDRVVAGAEVFAGARRPLALSRDLSAAIVELSRRAGVTPFMTLLAAFDALLGWYCGQQEILVGTDVANRTRAETEALIGFFVNQLVLRVSLQGDLSFAELLERVRVVTLQAYEHQDLPFDMLVKALNPKREVSGSPLYRAKLVLQNQPGRELLLANLQVAPLELERSTAITDLLLWLEEGRQGFHGSLEYSTRLFERETIADLLDHYRLLLERAVADPTLRLSALFATLDQAQRQAREARQDAFHQARQQKRRSLTLKPITGSNHS